MKLKIDPKPLAIMQLDLIGFETDYKKDLDLWPAFDNNCELLINKTELSDEEIRVLVYEETNWGSIFFTWKDAPNKEAIDFMVHSVEIDGVVLEKGSVSPDGAVHLKEVDYHAHEFLVANTYISKLEYHIDNYLSGVLFSFEGDWEPVLNWKK
jgi:hypothetical protein